MPTSTVSKQVVIGGLSITASVARTAEGQLSQQVSLPAGKAGTLSTRTGNTEGTATLANGHGITSGAVVDIYWTGGFLRGATVGTVATNSVPFSGGIGDNLPAQTTAIVMTPQIEVAASFASDTVEIVAVGCDQRASVDMVTAAEDSVLSAPIEIVEARAGFFWESNSGIASPFDGAETAMLIVSNGTTTAATLKFGVLLDTVV